MFISSKVVVSQLVLMRLLLLHPHLNDGSSIQNNPRNKVERDNANVTILRGSDYKIVCPSGQEIENHRTRWLKNGKMMEPKEYPRIEFSRKMLSLHNVKRKDEGVYECVVNDDNGTMVFNKSVVIKTKAKYFNTQVNPCEDTTLDSNEKPWHCDDDEEETLDKQLDCSKELASRNPLQNTGNYSAETFLCFDLQLKKKIMYHFIVKSAGTTVSLHCNARGYPAPEIKWSKDGVSLQKSDYNRKINRNSLTLLVVNQKDAGKYSCQINNGISNLSYDTRLIVNQRLPSVPIITMFWGKANLTVGETLNLTCEVLQKTTGSMYGVYFLRNDSTNHTEEFEPTDSTLDGGDLSVHHFTLPNVTHDDEGTYTCIAINSIGNSEKQVNVFVAPEETGIKTSIKTNWTVYNIILSLSFVAICACVYIYFIKKAMRGSETQNGHTTISYRAVISIDNHGYSQSGEMFEPSIKISSSGAVSGPIIEGQEYEFPLDPLWEVPRENLKVGQVLGEGAFGQVKLATATGIFQKDTSTLVAVKSLKKNHSEVELIDLISEMEIMKKLGHHDNIINLLGTCTVGGPLLVVMEYAMGGNLRDLLRRSRHHLMNPQSISPTASTDAVVLIEEPLTFGTLMNFAYQISRGLEYLTEKKYVHRDLAARNVLVNENMDIKIADFGMARYCDDYYRKKSDGRVPVKWMAPETLVDRIYTASSDVWSFGILLWEIITLGETPYPTILDASELLDFLKLGKRMAKPHHCPTELYLIMRECWLHEPKCRPTATELVSDIGQLLSLSSRSSEKYPQLQEDETQVITPVDTPRNSEIVVMFDPDFIKTLNI